MLNIKELSSLKVMNISTLLAENYSMESLEENGKGIIEGFICVLLHHEVLMCYSPGNFYFEEICFPLTTVECQFSMAKVFGLLPMSNSQDIWMQMTLGDEYIPCPTTQRNRGHWGNVHQRRALRPLPVVPHWHDRSHEEVSSDRNSVVMSQCVECSASWPLRLWHLNPLPLSRCMDRGERDGRGSKMMPLFSATNGKVSWNWRCGKTLPRTVCMRFVLKRKKSAFCIPSCISNVMNWKYDPVMVVSLGFIR